MRVCGFAILTAFLVLAASASAQQPDGPRRAGQTRAAPGEPLALQGAPGAARPVQTQAPVGDPAADSALEAPPVNNGAVIPSFQRRSGSRAGGPANDLNPSGRPDGERLPGGDIGAAVAGRELYHGNYCGYGNRGEGLPPTDALDAACMRHDACYDRVGYRSCKCDQSLEREANAVANSRRYSRELRLRAGLVVQAGNVMECRTP